MNWVEKYRPKTMAEVVGNTKIKEELKKWIEDYLQGKPVKPVLLVGPPGCGKTTLANALANDYGFEIIELNASDKRNKDVIKQVVGSASVSKSLSGKRALIILDEVDGISGNSDRGGVSEILKIIKTAKNPIILTANDIYKPSLMSLRNACKIVKIGSVHTNSIVPVLRRIALKEGFNVDDSVLKIIAKHAGGDVRAAINDLESLALGNDLNLEEVKELPDRDVEKNIFDAIRIIFKTTHYDIAVSSVYDVKEDIGTVEEWIAENIPREYKKKEDIVRAYDYLSKADIFLGRVYKRQYYGLWRYASALMTAGVALAKDEKYRGFVSYVRPTVFTKLMKTKAKRNILNKILNKISSKTHVATKRAREDLSYLQLILKSNPELGAELVEFYEFTVDEVEYLTNKTTAKKIFKIIKEKRELEEKLKSKLKTSEIEKDKNETKKKKKIKDKKVNNNEKNLKDSIETIEEIIKDTENKEKKEKELFNKTDDNKSKPSSAKKDKKDKNKEKPKQITLEAFF
ncbi:replication factor C large subunit [Methanothermococcus okinawensis]|uniref:Replication factor C large subunit n=1 Tax=Methanothermococcus okinawensis (strain DSM 14208 / JCM 11175 / IH1) TaxID=647113 RepID=F8AJZ8_METOI|nr:replication factor C large subunit [Methanothermococcus okinawensis]AEH07354.1 Replication factor C large subunit [Methanothermococcus okinawensis IH1]